MIVATIGVASIRVTPYMQATFTNAYNLLKPKETEVVYETPITDENPVEK